MFICISIVLQDANQYISSKHLNVYLFKATNKANVLVSLFFIAANFEHLSHFFIISTVDFEHECFCWVTFRNCTYHIKSELL